MLRKWLCTIVVLLLLPVKLLAQETHLVAYAGFGGFQAPVWAPKDLGLFDKYGFKGDVVLVPGSVRQIQALQGGSIHFAQVDAATAINAINQGADMVMLSGSLNSFPYSFMAQKEIRKPEDLAGKKIGVLGVGGATETATILALRAGECAALVGDDLSRRRFDGSHRCHVGQSHRCHRAVVPRYQ